jgi:hypothetical protein
MDHTDVGLRAAIRALSDVVAPVVGPEHAQARDQLRLTVDYLAFVVERLPELHRRDRFELSHHLAMAQTVQSALGGQPAPQLQGAIDAGTTMLQLAGPPTQALRQATAKLCAAISAVVRDAAELEAAVRREVERSVLHASHERIAFERAWYQPLGLDPDPQDVRPLAEFLPASR